MSIDMYCASSYGLEVFYRGLSPEQVSSIGSTQVSSDAIQQDGCLSKKKKRKLRSHLLVIDKCLQPNGGAYGCPHVMILCYGYQQPNIKTNLGLAKKQESSWV